MTTIRYTTMDSPLGPLTLAAGERGLVELRLPRGGRAAPPDRGWVREDAALAGAVRQLREYFAGVRRSFDLELAPRGTPFQRAVWEALCAIPYGEVASYGEIARRIGRPGASRAVGAANGANPIAIVVPCHRVIGADGSLTGYGGGLPIKRALLALESGEARAPRKACAASRDGAPSGRSSALASPPKAATSATPFPSRLPAAGVGRPAGGRR